MKATAAICIALLAAIAIDASAVETIVADTSVDAFARPMQGLLPSERERFFNGRSLIHQSWVVAPSKDASVSGLGPLYNSLACISCHPRNGRGRPPDEPDERMQSTLVRLSVASSMRKGFPASPAKDARRSTGRTRNRSPWRAAQRYPCVAPGLNFKTLPMGRWSRS